MVLMMFIIINISLGSMRLMAEVVDNAVETVPTHPFLSASISRLQSSPDVDLIIATLVVY
jgi:hypothetical protein